MRRLKSEVLPQLPAKRRVVVPIALDNDAEYRLAEDDVIAWLRSQPLELAELNAKIAATLRAERLAQLSALQRLAARGKLAAALAWIEDFLASGEPLVVFARHVEVQQAVLERFPDALHLLGEDSLDPRERRHRGVPGARRAAADRLRDAGRRRRASRSRAPRTSCFLELEWTPAMHDQAEDRCHRIGQHDAVTAWYLLAAETIDETMAALIQRKRGIVAAVTDGAARRRRRAGRGCRPGAAGWQAAAAAAAGGAERAAERAAGGGPVGLWLWRSVQAVGPGRHRAGLGKRSRFE